MEVLTVWLDCQQFTVSIQTRPSSASAAQRCGRFQMSIKPHCFFNLGLKRRVWKALSTTLGRWIGFLCSRSRLLVDPLCFFFLGALSLAQSLAAFCLESSATRGTRKTQLEWRSCSAELEATVGDENEEKS